MKNCDIVHIFAQNRDRGHTLEGGSNEYPRSMFWSKNKKNVYPCKPQFYFIKVGCKGVSITRTCYPGVCFGVMSVFFFQQKKDSSKDMVC